MAPFQATITQHEALLVPFHCATSYISLCPSSHHTSSIMQANTPPTRGAYNRLSSESGPSGRQISYEHRWKSKPNVKTSLQITRRPTISRELFRFTPLGSYQPSTSSNGPSSTCQRISLLLTSTNRLSRTRKTWRFRAPAGTPSAIH